MTNEPTYFFRDARRDAEIHPIPLEALPPEALADLPDEANAKRLYWSELFETWRALGGSLVHVPTPKSKPRSK